MTSMAMSRPSAWEVTRSGARSRSPGGCSLPGAPTRPSTGWTGPAAGGTGPGSPGTSTCGSRPSRRWAGMRRLRRPGGIGSGGRSAFDHFRDYVERIPAEERRRWTDRAVATAEERHQDVGSALRFLTRIDETEAAERLVLTRAKEIDGHLYFVLRPVAEALAPAHPLGAVILYRAMASAVLGAARSKSYSYAARDLLQAGRLAERVTDWNGLPDHEEFMRRLRQEHGRKNSSWRLIEGK